MKPPSNILSPQTNAEHTADTSGSARGWYLYGITLRQVAARLTGNLAADVGEPLLFLKQGKLAGVVRPVALAEFSAEALQARAQDLAWLEAMVRGHNQVVESIHQAGAVLPVKFGSVYLDSEALQAALAERHDALLAQLQRVQGCDEWGLHLYADRQAVQRLVGAHPSLQQLQGELAGASPGRAYLLKGKLAEAMDSITERALNCLAQANYDCLAHYAIAGQMNPCPHQPADGLSEREVLSASFLVQRATSDGFLQEMQRLVNEQEGLRCEYSGPWPPYSFASSGQEEKP